MTVGQKVEARSVALDDGVRKAVAFMVKNYGKPVALEDLAHEARCDGFELSEHFQTIYGLGPIQWLWMFRTIMAAELLSQTPQFSLEEVAKGCGFGHVRHFGQCFKNLLGDTPEDFRAQAVQIQNAERKQQQRKAALRFEQIEVAQSALVGCALEKILSLLRPMANTRHLERNERSSRP